LAQPAQADRGDKAGQLIRRPADRRSLGAVSRATGLHAQQVRPTGVVPGASFDGGQLSEKLLAKAKAKEKVAALAA